MFQVWPTVGIGKVYERMKCDHCLREMELGGRVEVIEGDFEEECF